MNKEKDCCKECENQPPWRVKPNCANPSCPCHKSTLKERFEELPEVKAIRSAGGNATARTLFEFMTLEVEKARAVGATEAIERAMENLPVERCTLCGTEMEKNDAHLGFKECLDKVHVTLQALKEEYSK